ncbi:MULTISPECIES: DUF4625 domain-containing protein [unclassified Lentimicrobium]|uniref:DUF4625 domain-containing protein n=1 Tax=unclassified Lentimicrobium TaxID=2677434 RepID=UPI001551E200|nr:MULTISPECIES: DUF4625 domain-containing protein [unclassified Lentimicrobium]NPD43994.1 DUF4625 domain-containing protein [Lentimicrobium sp. S6]NPD84092.1 DUF4625 domain-containing protein [Lentimicrobium sp. L6]
MNTRILLISIALITAIVFSSCTKEDEIAKPVITIHELGHGDSHSNDYAVAIGGDLHMDVDIVAEGKINTVQVRIHPEGEHKGEGEHEEWEIDTVYTKFYGLKNTTFHEHLEIDSLAEAGDYHFDFIVTDLEGNQSSAEAELQLIEE